jgi:spoIIIJ-associated protein
MPNVEATGHSLEEAKKNALEMLGIQDESQVQFEVIEEGKKGLFGLGHAQVRIVATLIEETPEQVETREAPDYFIDEPTARQISDYVQNLLNKSPIQVQVVLRGMHARYADLELIGRDVAYLVGKNGEVIDSLQYLLNMIISRRVHPQARLVIDGGGWRRRREERLRNQVMVIALEVKQRGEEAVLPPMPAHERRIIHNVLKDDLEVSTYSEGDEPNRRVIISPSKADDSAPRREEDN